MALGQVNDSAPEENFSDIIQFTDEKYGVDQQIVNGKYYAYKYKHALGHPFLFENNYFIGKVIIRGTEYKGINLKYDIYNQSLLIKSPIENYEIETLLPIEIVNAFSWDEMWFRRYTLNEKGPAYYQVVAEEDNIACLQYWYKTREESLHNVTFSSYKFRLKRCKKFIDAQGKIDQFKNNRSFVKILPAEIQREMQSYLKSKKFKVRKVSDLEMKEIIQRCSTLLQQEMVQ